jgi:hypothetical protein
MQFRPARPSVLTMRRILLAAVATLLAIALIAPAAQATKRYGYFQDLTLAPSAPSSIFLTILYKDDHGHGKFTPRAAVSYRFDTPVSCPSGNPGNLQFSGNEFNKYGYFREQLRGSLFSHTFESQFENPQTAPLKGYVKGNVLTREKRGTPQVNGSVYIADWDAPSGVSDCMMPSEHYSATPCKRWISPKAPKHASWKKRKLPVCRQTW